MIDPSVPRVTDEDVARLVVRDFPASQVAEVSEVLARYGRESWHGETARVRAAILKLAAGRRSEVEIWVTVACTDYRDVLAPAEYPEAMANMPWSRGADPDESAAVVRRDRQQYEIWFSRP